MGAMDGKFGAERGEVIEGGMFAVGEELAHVRARFAGDPTLPTLPAVPTLPSLLAEAWKTPTGTTEEDETELIDAVADCVSVGVPVDAALASWRAGLLEVSESEEDQYDDDDEEDADFDDAETGVFHRQDG